MSATGNLRMDELEKCHDTINELWEMLNHIHFMVCISNRDYPPAFHNSLKKAKELLERTAP